MPKIAIILGSTRTGRAGANVAPWVLEQARQRGRALSYGRRTSFPAA
ncbi:hypothetical protein AB0G71_22585 [Streptomyces sp. NPDC020403]